MSNPPVCNVQGVVKLPDQGVQNLVKLQPVPKATDLASALKAIQVLTNNFNTINNFYTTNDTVGNNSRTQQQKAGNFSEVRAERITKKMKIYDPDDREVFVEVEMINGLTFKDPASGRNIRWSR